MNKWAFLFFLLSTLAQAEPVASNSFLIEEAYNQEPGVVQFIQSFRKPKDGKSWLYNLTVEVPIQDENHQVSVDLPVGHTQSSQTELGDIQLNYRRQLAASKDVVSTARLSLGLPTGEEKHDLGSGNVGAEAALISSVAVSKKWMQHFNFGFGFTPSAKDGSGNQADVQKFFWGFSNIYLVTDDFNLMFEVVGTQEEQVLPGNVAAWTQSTVINPGLRYGFDVSGWDVVPGLSIPLQVGNGEHTTSIFAYLSIEGILF